MITSSINTNNPYRIFIESVLLTLKGQCFIQAKPSMPVPISAIDRRSIELSVCQDISCDAIKGSIAISFSRESFLGIMSHMLGETRKELTANLMDGAKEILNIALGLSKDAFKRDGQSLLNENSRLVPGFGGIVDLCGAGGSPFVCPLETTAGAIFLIIVPSHIKEKYLSDEWISGVKLYSENYGILGDQVESRQDAMGLRVLRVEYEQLLFKLRQARDAAEKKSSDLEAMNQQLLAAQAELIHASKMACLGEMASGLAHEINNPVAVINSRIEDILGHLKHCRLEPKAAIGGSALNVEEIGAAAVVIKGMSDHISSIVSSLRTYARDASNDPLEAIDLRTILDQTVNLCGSKLKHLDIDLQYSLPSGVPSLLNCRPSQISQVLVNLLSNSMDAIGDSKERWIKIQLSESDSFYLLSVTDSGAGIPELIKHRIFDPFFTTKSPGKGTGLGLSIAKGIIDSHRGVLMIDETSEKTRFIVKLPKIMAS